ncbi:MAG: META domain-containing protein [Actinobacteria bacterium]|nr:META domain-containing protein [Actinomycetota bacterium]
MDDDLRGTWTITELLPNGIRPQTAEITFEDHRLYFYAGCNRAMGSYTIDGHTLTAGPVALTMMYCPDMSAEQHLCRVLAEPLDVSFDGDTLTATGPVGGFTARRA